MITGAAGAARFAAPFASRTGKSPGGHQNDKTEGET